MIEKLIKIAKLTALISLVTGTAIFALYFFTSNFVLLGVGYCYMALAGITNLFVLILILNAAAMNKQHSKRLLMQVGLMLINIPIVLAYCWATMVLLDTMRITFTNKTNGQLTDIHLTGCEYKQIGSLAPGGTKTIWVAIEGDCSITMDYIAQGKRKKEIVAGYLTGGSGEKMAHHIGSNQNKVR